MSLLQAFEETFAGKEDRAGITAVDVYTANVLNDPAHSQQDKLDEVKNVVDANLPDPERKWFLLAGVIANWGLSSEALSESIRDKLDDDENPLAPMAQYHAIRAMGVAAGGLLPNDLLNTQYLKKSQPKLWAELFLSAYRNGNPSHITKTLVELIEGDKPLMHWKSLRALFPEIRTAYGSPTEFRKQIQEIACRLSNHVAKSEILKAADKRVGGGVSSEDRKRVSSRKQFYISLKPIRRDKVYSQKIIAPNGELVLQ